MSTKIVRILLTGFEPFYNESINSSWKVVSSFSIKNSSVKIKKVCLPVSFNKAVAELEESVTRYMPDIVLCLGQSSSRFEINVERVAINVRHNTKPDNDGNTYKDVPVFPEGPDAYFSNLPIRQMVESVCRKDIPAIVSNTAGTFVCNTVFYAAMHLVHTKFPSLRAGFIHIPYLPCQAVGKTKQPSMSKEMICQALEIMIQEAIAVSVR